LQKKNINLLQHRTAPPTFWDRTYVWITKTGRVIVILTEALVLIAFGWRFWLDRSLNDLKDEIEVRGAVLKSLHEDEVEIGILQQKMATYKSLWNQGSRYSKVMEEVNGYLPQSAEGLNVTIDYIEDETGTYLLCTISGRAPRDEIQVLEDEINESEIFYDKNLGDIELEGEGGVIYNFSVSAKVVSDVAREPLGITYENTES